MYVIIFSAQDDLWAYGPYDTADEALAALRAWHVRTELDADPTADPIALAQESLEQINSSYSAGCLGFALTIRPLIPLHT